MIQDFILPVPKKIPKNHCKVGMNAYVDCHNEPLYDQMNITNNTV